MSTSPMRDNPTIPSSIYDKLDTLDTDLNAGFAENDKNLEAAKASIDSGFGTNHSDLATISSRVNSINTNMATVSSVNALGSLLSQIITLMETQNSLLEDIRNNAAGE